MCVREREREREIDIFEFIWREGVKMRERNSVEREISECERMCVRERERVCE